MAVKLFKWEWNSKMKKIKICYFINGFSNGGAERSLFRYLSFMDLSKFEIHLIVYDNIIDKKSLDEFFNLGIQIFIIPLWKKSFWKSCKKTTEIFRREQYDIIHAHMTDLNWLPLLLSLFVLPVKKTVRISHSHMYYSNIRLSIQRRIIYKIEGGLGRLAATHYFACGRDAGISLFGKKNVVKGNVYIVRNALNIEEFLFSYDTRQKYRRKLNLDNSFVIGNIARFEKQKNHFFLLGLFEQFVKIYPNSKLLLIGCGSLEKRIRKLVHEKNLDDKVIFGGTTNQISLIYQIMDVFVLPSLYEGLSIVGIEAQIAGLPVLCSSNISEETKITDLLKFLSIENGYDEWVVELLSCANVERKQICMEDIQKTGYDIRLETKKLENKYISLFCQTRN